MVRVARVIPTGRDHRHDRRGFALPREARRLQLGGIHRKHGVGALEALRETIVHRGESATNAHTHMSS